MDSGGAESVIACPAMRESAPRFASPLRYPGGKTPMAGLLREIRALNDLGKYTIAEPFAGGAGAALTLLLADDAPGISINDLDPAIHDFWHSAVHDSEAFLACLDASPVSVAEWRRWREIACAADSSPLARGFAAFYLNRSNRSGIIKNGSVIGGLGQDGHWKIGARFNKQTLRARFERIARVRDRICVSNSDGLEFIGGIDARRVFLFIDPPYYRKGRTLYLNGLEEQYHADLADTLRSMDGAAWVLTYDDCDKVRELYADWAALRPFSLRYTASRRRQGHEVLIAPRSLRLPATIALVR